MKNEIPRRAGQGATGAGEGFQQTQVTTTPALKQLIPVEVEIATQFLRLILPPTGPYAAWIRFPDGRSFNAFAHSIDELWQSCAGMISVARPSIMLARPSGKQSTILQAPQFTRENWVARTTTLQHSNASSLISMLARASRTNRRNHIGAAETRRTQCWNFAVRRGCPIRCWFRAGMGFTATGR